MVELFSVIKKHDISQVVENNNIFKIQFATKDYFSYFLYFLIPAWSIGEIYNLLYFVFFVSRFFIVYPQIVFVKSMCLTNRWSSYL